MPAGGILSNFDGKIKLAWKTYKTWSQKLRLPIARVTWCCLNQGNPLTYGHARHLLTVTLRDFSHPPQKKCSHFNSRVTSASRIILWSRALNFNRNIRSSQWAWSTMNSHRQNVPGKISVEINDCCLHLHQLYADTSQWSPRRHTSFSLIWEPPPSPRQVGKNSSIRLQSIILLHKKFLQFYWLRAVVF